MRKYGSVMHIKLQGQMHKGRQVSVFSWVQTEVDPSPLEDKTGTCCSVAELRDMEWVDEKGAANAISRYRGKV